MKIKKAVIMTSTCGCDKVRLHTDLPSPSPPTISSQPLVMTFDVQQGKGVQYVKENFGIDAEVIWN